MHEIELKLAVPPAARAVVLRELRRGAVHQQTLRASYFDTADEALSRHGLSLRLRQEGRRWVQTLKAPGADPLQRFEHEVELPAGSKPTLVDTRLHQGSPADAMLHEVLGAAVAGGGLALRYGTEVRRTTRTLRFENARIEIAFDEGRVVAGDRSLPIREVEFELKAGSPAAVPRLAARWIERHGLWIATPTKAERGAWLASGQHAVEPVRAVPPRVREEDGAQAFLSATLASCLAQAFGNASHVAGGDESEELVHQLRIGLRRLRTALRELGLLGSGFPAEWEPMLRAAFAELGAQRDAEQVVPAVAAQLAAAGGPALPLPRIVGGARRPQAVARDPAFQRTLLEILAHAHVPAPAAIDDAGRLPSARELVAGRLKVLHRQVVRDARRFRDLDTLQQHRVRKRLKRLRYLSEFSSPLFGPKRVERYLAAWKKAQDALGEYNDARIATEAYRAEAEKHPAAWFAVGWLEAGKSQSVKRCARALRAAGKTTPFWERSS